MLTPEATIVRITVRQLLALRGAIIVLLLAASPAIFAAIFRLRGGADAETFFRMSFTELVVPVVLPVTALVLGTGAFGAEREEGTLVYLLTKPIPRWRVALTKLLTAAGLTTVFAVGSCLLAGMITFGGVGPERVLVSTVVALALGSVVYCSLFVALGLFVKRAVLVGLAYVVIWESAAAQTFAGSRSLSVAQYVRSVADALAGAELGQFGGVLPTSTSLGMSTAVLALSALLASVRLSRFELAD